MNKAYEEMKKESSRRAQLSGLSTIKYWLENDVDEGEDEMPKPHYRPISYLKVAVCWAFYYLKHEF